MVLENNFPFNISKPHIAVVVALQMFIIIIIINLLSAAIKPLNWAGSNAKLRNVKAFLPIWKEDEREQINHRIVDAGNILENLTSLFAFHLPFIVQPAVFWQSGFSKAVVLKVIGYHCFLLRVYKNLTDKEDFRSLGNECHCSSEELTVPNIYRNAKGIFFFFFPQWFFVLSRHLRCLCICQLICVCFRAGICSHSLNNHLLTFCAILKLHLTRGLRMS